MRLIKIAAAALALSFAGQAEAIPTITGVATTDSSGNFSLPVPFIPVGHEWRGHITLQTQNPVSAYVHMFVTKVYGGCDITGCTLYDGNWPLEANGQNIYEAFYRTSGVGYPQAYNITAGLAELFVHAGPNTEVSYKMQSLGVPEPATWALMILGFGGIGAALRTHGRRRGTRGTAVVAAG